LEKIEEYQLPAEPDTRGLPWVFILLLLGSVSGEFGLVGLIEHSSEFLPIYNIPTPNMLTMPCQHSRC